MSRISRRRFPAVSSRECAQRGVGLILVNLALPRDLILTSRSEAAEP